MSKQGKFKGSFNNLFGEIEPIKHDEEIEVKEETIQPIKEEVKKTTEEAIQPIKEEKVIEVKKNNKKVDSEEVKEIPKRKKRNYYIPIDMLEEMKKVVYMDRELGGNYTELVLTALRQYLDSKKDLIEEYNKIKEEN